MLRTTVVMTGLLLTFSLSAGEKLKSGNKVGDPIGSFNVRDITGPKKGKSLCYT